MVIFTVLLGGSAQWGECRDPRKPQGGLQEGDVLVPPSPRRRTAQRGTDSAHSQGLQALLPGSPGTWSQG